MTKYAVNNLDPVLEIPEELREVSVDPPNYEEEPFMAELWAKRAYWVGTSNKDIAAAINAPTVVVTHWVNGIGKFRTSWRDEKAKYLEKVAKKIVPQYRERFKYALEDMMTVVERSVATMIDNQDALSPTQLRQFVSSMKEIFTMNQLLMGEPTDIFANGKEKAITWAEIVTKIQDVDILDYDEKGDLKPKKPKSKDVKVKGTLKLD